MNWEKEFERLMSSVTDDNLWQSSGGEIIRDGKAIVQKAIDEVLTVVPMSEPPLSKERLAQFRELSQANPPARPDIKQFLDMINWQKAVIAHMAKDNGYQEGVEAGKRAAVELLRSYCEEEWNINNGPFADGGRMALRNAVQLISNGRIEGR